MSRSVYSVKMSSRRGSLYTLGNALFTSGVSGVLESVCSSSSKSEIETIFL